MCVLCGQMLTEIHWSDRQLDPQQISCGTDESLRRQSRHARLKLIAKVLAQFHLEVSDDLSSSNYVVGDRKGHRQVIANMAELWAEASKLAGRALDPLDTALLDGLAGIIAEQPDD